MKRKRNAGRNNGLTASVRRWVNKLVKRYFAGELTFDQLADQVVDAMLPIVYAVISSPKFRQNLTGYCDAEDLISQAKLGIIKALRRLKPKYPNPFAFIRIHAVNSVKKLNQRLVESGEMLKVNVGLWCEGDDDESESVCGDWLGGAAGGLSYTIQDQLFLIELRDYVQKFLTPAEREWLEKLLSGEDLSELELAQLREKLKPFFGISEGDGDDSSRGDNQIH